METIKVKVLKCSNSAYWYADLIGHTVEVFPKTISKRTNVNGEQIITDIYLVATTGKTKKAIDAVDVEITN